MARVDGGPVRPHVQAFADEITSRFGVRCSTYEGHQPTRDRALDIFATREQGDAVCDFAQANWQHFGGDYWIWRQRIWNPPDRAYWRQMEDRGSVTANHYDHVHISFEPNAAASPGAPKEDDLTPEQAKRLEGVEGAVRKIEAALWDPTFGLMKANGGVTAQLAEVLARLPKSGE